MTPGASTTQTGHRLLWTPDEQRRIDALRRVVELNPKLLKTVKPRLNRYIKNTPTVKQTAGLLLNHYLEGLYGGAGGGGKTDWLLMAALQYFDVPGYEGILLRRTYGQLYLADSILDRAHRWLRNLTGVKWEAEHMRFVSPEGGRLTFGYLQYDSDCYRYDSAAFQFIGFDELTQFTEFQYRFMFARHRRCRGFDVPLRVRAATNPGNVGHLWVKQRFVMPGSCNDQRFFIKALLTDNPHLDVESYLQSLAKLDPVMRKQREKGDWDAEAEGARFKRHWFKKFVDVNAVPVEGRSCRYWDLAATKGGGDYLVGAKVRQCKNGMWVVEDVKRGQWSPMELKAIILQTAQLDGKQCMQVIEQEPGASGKIVIDDYVRLLAGFNVKGIRSSGPKEIRWNPFAAQAEADNVIVCNGPWNRDWLDEMCAVPNAEHDDQADATAGAFNALCAEPKRFYGIDFLK